MVRQVADAAMMLPRLLRRERAAGYLSVSPTFFDKLVKVGTVPPPKRLADGMKAWDRADLDAVVDGLEYDGPAAAPADTSWDD